MARQPVCSRASRFQHVRSTSWYRSQAVFLLVHCIRPLMAQSGHHWSPMASPAVAINYGVVADSEHRGGALSVRIIVTCTLVMLLAGCETKAPVPPATSKEREQALSALNDCLQVAARRLDDGKSEATKVAWNLRSSCAAEFARSRDAYARSLNSQQASQYHRQDDQAFTQAATNAVLEERAQRRQ
jgi:hypothetical protein